MQAAFKHPSHTPEAPLTQAYICNWETIQCGADSHDITSNKHSQHDWTPYPSGACAVLARAALTDSLLLQKSCTRTLWWQMHHSSTGEQPRHFPCAPTSLYSLDSSASVVLLEKLLATPNMSKTLHNFQNSTYPIHLSSSFPPENGGIFSFFLKTALYPQLSVDYQLHFLHILNLLSGDLLLCHSEHSYLIYPSPNGHIAQC